VRIDERLGLEHHFVERAAREVVDQVPVERAVGIQRESAAD
jgi:hypothetical protein